MTRTAMLRVTRTGIALAFAVLVAAAPAALASPSGSITNAHAVDGQVEATFATYFDVCYGSYCGWSARAYQYPASEACAPNGSHFIYAGDLHDSSGSESVAHKFYPVFTGSIRLCLYAYQYPKEYFIAEAVFNPSASWSGSIANIHAVGGQIEATYLTDFHVCTLGDCSWFAYADQYPASQACAPDRTGSHVFYVDELHTASGSESETTAFRPALPGSIRLCLYAYHHGADYFIAQAVYGTTGPTIRITAPADGAHYKQGQTARAAYSCAGGTFAVSFCQGPAANGRPIDTTTTGRHSFTVQATDTAGNAATTTVHYTVDSTEKTPPTLKGFPPNQGCVPKGLNLKVSVHPTRLKRAEVLLDGKRIATSKTPDFKVKVPASRLKPGRHEVKIVREYKSGTKRHSTFTFATCRGGGRSPHIRTEGTPDRGRCTAKPFQIVVTISGAKVKTIAVKLDGKKLATPAKAKFTLSIDVRKLSAGAHRLKISAADKFGNGSVSVTNFVRCFG